MRVSLRDYFAATALAGILQGTQDFDDQLQIRDDYEGYCLRCAESAYNMADAMIAARKGGDE